MYFNLINFSFFSLKEIKSSIFAIASLCFFANLNKSSPFAIVPSSFIISHITAAGSLLDSLAISTDASVWPALTRTPSRAIIGNTCPGETISFLLGFFLVATFIVLARSFVDIPVVIPFLLQ